MTTYIVGDIHGSFTAFSYLLEQVKFDSTNDRLLSVGDLINRGHDNLSTLRWFYRHRESATVVLGNHDLHLLASRTNAKRIRKSDNFHDILNAPDGEILMDWLQQQPLMYRKGNVLLVHAGIPPCWSSEQAIKYSTEVSAMLNSERAGDFFRTLYGDEPSSWSEHLSGLARLRVITNYFTRMRHCTPSGRLDLKSKGPQPNLKFLAGEPLGPWFKHTNQLHPDERVFFGHWASLRGDTGDKQFIGLDSGCIWGGRLTFYALETGQTWSSNYGACA